MTTFNIPLPGDNDSQQEPTQMTELEMRQLQARQMKMAFESPNMKCKECEGQVFDQKFIVKVISPLHPDNISQQERLAAFPVWACAKCGSVGGNEANLIENKNE